MVSKGRSGLPRYCGWNADRHGKRRVRFRRGAFSTYLPGTPWGEEFMRAYAAALEGGRRAEGAGEGRTVPGSISALLVRYYRSPEFRGLRATTQATYRGILERFRAGYGNDLVRQLRREHVKAIIGRMSTRPAAANNLLRLLRMLLGFAVDIEMIPVNPAVGIKGYRIAGEGFHTWTEDEIARFEAVHPLGTKARLALALLLYTGQRRGDVVRMGWQHVTPDGRLRVVQQKTERALEIRMHARLTEALEAVPRGHLTFLTTSQGAAFTPAGFGNWFRAQCNAAQLKHCSAHGLRKAAARRLAEAGNSANRIAAVTGHKTLKEVERYTRAADQVRLADAAVSTLSEGSEREHKLSNLPERLDKTGAK